MSGIASSQSFAMKAAGAGLLARREYRSHLDGLCAESQCGDYTSCISYSPAAITGTSTMSTTSEAGLPASSCLDFEDDFNRHGHA